MRRSEQHGLSVQWNAGFPRRQDIVGNMQHLIGFVSDRCPS
jgi:hypothetical protein